MLHDFCVGPIVKVVQNYECFLGDTLGCSTTSLFRAAASIVKIALILVQSPIEAEFEEEDNLHAFSLVHP